MKELSGALKSQVQPYRPPEQRTRPRGPNSTAVGSIKKGGRWRLDRDTALGVVVGSVKLDLRGAELAAPDVTLAAETVLGSIKVWVPYGVRVVVDGTTVVGTRRVDEDDRVPSHAAGPVLRLRLDTVVGSVKVFRV